MTTATQYAQQLIDAKNLQEYLAISKRGQQDKSIDFWDVCLEQKRLDREAHPWPVITEAGEFER